MTTNLAGHQRSLRPVLEECTAEHRCETGAGTEFCDSIIGHGLAIRKALEIVRLVAPTETTVLIGRRNWHGQGKLIARAVHEPSGGRTHLRERELCSARAIADFLGAVQARSKRCLFRI